MKRDIKSEEPSEYTASSTFTTYGKIEQHIIDSALKILRERHERGNKININSPQDTRDYLSIELNDLQHEVFGCIFLTNRHAVITNKQLFRGTIDGASVYSREVVKEALDCNAAAVIFYHNHPSGITEPSSSDISLTRKLKSALELVDIRVLDHFVTGGGNTSSMADLGLI